MFLHVDRRRGQRFVITELHITLRHRPITMNPAGPKRDKRDTCHWIWHTLRHDRPLGRAFVANTPCNPICYVSREVMGMRT